MKSGLETELKIDALRVDKNILFTRIPMLQMNTYTVISCQTGLFRQRILLKSKLYFRR